MPFDIQMTIAKNVRYNHRRTENEMKELCVSEIVPSCSLARSKLDIAFYCCQSDQNLLLGFWEAKNLKGDFDNEDTQSAIKQTICYSLVPLAYSLWGVLRMMKHREISSLLVMPLCVYRLTFTKGDGPFGIKLRIERSTDLNMMRHMVYQSVMQCITLYDLLQQGKVQLEATVNPRDWSPVNFDFEKGVEEKFRKSHNLGFLFRAKSKTMQEFATKCWRRLLSDISGDDEVVLIVKYHSAILDLDYQASDANMQKMIDYLEKEAKAKSAAAKSAAEIARLTALLARSGLSSDELGSGSTSAEASLPNADATASIDASCVIKHPYIGYLISHLGVLATIIVMNDTGPTLREQMKDASFRSRWESEINLRKAFYADVGMSALNLVEAVRLGHEDIRPPNITVKGNSFHLIDFDNCSLETRFSKSPLIVGVESILTKLMIISVAQIAFVVFELEHEGPIRAIWDKWLMGVRFGPLKTTSFNNWVSDTGLEPLFTPPRHPSEPPLQRGVMDLAFMKTMLLQMLRLKGLDAPASPH